MEEKDITEISSALTMTYMDERKNEKASKSLDKSSIPKVPAKDIQKDFFLGNGSFGDVFKGTYKQHTIIALKCLKNKGLGSDFNKEANIMMNLRHCNIVQFYGITEINDQTALIIEYLEEGSLSSVLRNSSGLTVGDFFHIAHQIASGMCYLASKKILHRDLATRNCLVGKNLEVKIADFGLSSHCVVEGCYEIKQGIPIPIAWSAPEVIQERKFSFGSDVWSFGVVMWEIFTHGQSPWYGLSMDQVKKNIIDGRKLSYDSITSYDAIIIMDEDCWQQCPELRANISSIHRKLVSNCNYKIPNCKRESAVCCIM